MNKILILILGSLLLSSCARNISSDHYAASHVGEASTTYMGVIRSVRQVRVGHGESLDDNGLGMAGGGVAGGVLGSSIGRGNLFPTALGAVAGAVAGSFAEKKMKEQNALEFIVELDGGGMMTVVQGLDSHLMIGQPVYVQVSQSGRSRIIPQF